MGAPTTVTELKFEAETTLDSEQCREIKRRTRADGFAFQSVNGRATLTLYRRNGWRNPQRIVDLAKKYGWWAIG